MQPTVYQKPEIRDANDNIIQQGAFGKNTALANATNDGWIDYVANDLEFLYDLAKDEIVPVPSLPASGQLNKTYLLTTTGVSYRWSGTQWVAVSSSEAVGRAESAALLAEQWATKTDGTVDGTEYSAKYYAEQAQQSADDAQDVADDMADHLVQIDKNTGGVSKNSKRISNIEKLLQGNLYDYDVDDDEAYTKTVPSGAMPFASLDKLGGKTLVWNQISENGSFEAVNGWTATGCSRAVADNVLTATVTSVVSSGRIYCSNSYCQTIVNHKYLCLCDVLTPRDSSFRIQYSTIATPTPQIAVSANTFTRISSIFTCTDANGLHLYYDITSALQVGDEVKYKNLMVFDLTLMFGAGNEPSTVAEFETMFPADYYSYNAGTLLSAGVTEVKNVGKNLLDVMNPWRYGSSFYNLEIGTQLVGNSPTFKPTDNGDGTFTFTPQNSWYGFIFLAEVDMSKTYHFHAESQSTNNRTILYLLDSDHKILWKNNPSTAATQNLSVTFGGAETQYPQAKYFAFANGVGSSGAGVTVTITNPQLEVGETATTYVPYKEATMPIPAEVKALDGYGWSAGSVSNYIDFERKVFVKNVGRVDLGDMSWTKSTSENHELFYCSVNDIKEASATTVKGNIVCPAYMSGTYGNVYNHTYDKIIGVSNTSHRVAVYDTNTLSLTATQFKSAMSGIYLYYEMETPIETDISAYLTDNLIEVGAGGTLTFPNQNGADYHIPVPSTETYMIDLQEAISNG